jgi:hypothetical protein
MKGAIVEYKIVFLVAAISKLHRVFLRMKLNAKKDVLFSISIKPILQMKTHNILSACRIANLRQGSLKSKMI